MNRYVRPCSRCRSSIRLRICAWIETSRADTGSSATIIDGRSISARASPSRCRCPPENSCGYRSAAAAGSPTSSSMAETRFACEARFPSRWMIIGSRRIVPTRIRGSIDA